MEYLLKASAIITLFYFSYKLFLQRETFFESNRWFLLSGLAIALILPFVVIPVYIEVTPTPIINSSNIIIPNNTTSVTGSTNPIDILTILIWVYGLGVALFLGKFLINMSSLIKLLTNYTPKRIQNYLHIETKNTIAPFSFFNWIVYNPTQFKEQELQLIINHEKVHVNHWHSIDVLISQLACIAFWFNPFVWFYKKDLQQNLEFIADKKAQHNSDCKQSYQRLLLKASVPNHQLVVANNFYNSLIKKRIIMLHKSKSKSLNAWKYVLIIPALALFLMSFNIKEIYIVKDAIENNAIENEFTVSENTTEKELKTIENFFSRKEVKLKFTDVIRNENNAIENISINTKYKTDKQFVKRMTLTKSNQNVIVPFKLGYDNATEDISFNTQNNVIVDTPTIADNKITFTKDATISEATNPKKENAISNADNSLGENPIYIIEGKPYKKSELASRKLYTYGSITQLNKKESLKTYGNAGKDGAIIFNGKTTYKNLATPIYNNHEMIIITKNYTEADLNLAKAKLAKEGLKVKFKGIKRNTKGEIIAIKIDVSSNNSKASYNLDSDEPINPIKISFDREGNNISIGDASISYGKNPLHKNKGWNVSYFLNDDDHDNENHNHNIDCDHNTHSNNRVYSLSNSNRNNSNYIIDLKNKNVSGEIIELQNGTNAYFIKSNKTKINGHHVIIEADTVFFGHKEKILKLHSNHDNIKYEIKKSHKGSFFFVTTDDGENPLILLDGKEITKSEMDKLDADIIYKVEIIKDGDSTKEYGDKAKDGVIIITTKKE